MKKVYKILLALLVLLLLIGCESGQEVAVSSESFKDIAGSDAWYMNYADYAIRNRFFTGAEGSEFEPERELTRGEAVAVLGRVHEKISGEEIPADVKSSYSDVKKRKNYSRYVAWAEESDLLGAYTEAFEPERGITREEMALFFYNYINFMGIHREFEPLEYGDADEASPDAQEAIRELAHYDLFRCEDCDENGLGLLHPKEVVLRGEATSLFVKLYQKLTYPIDEKTPRVRYLHFQKYDKEELWDSWPLAKGESKIITNLQDYNDFMAGLPIEAKPLENGPLLTVNDSTFDEYCVVAVDIPSSFDQSEPFADVACSVSGDTLEITLVSFTERYYENYELVEDSILSTLHLLQVPKNVTEVEVGRYQWVEEVEVEPQSEAGTIQTHGANDSEALTLSGEDSDRLRELFADESWLEGEFVEHTPTYVITLDETTYLVCIENGEIEPFYSFYCGDNYGGKAAGDMQVLEEIVSICREYIPEA